MARPKTNAAEALKRTRESARKVSEQTGKKRLGRLLRKAQADLNQRIVRAEGLKGPGKDSFTATQLRITLLQVEQVVKDLNRGVKDLIVSQGKTAADAAASGTLDYMARAERKYKGINARLPLAEAVLKDRAVTRTEASILRRLTAAGDPAGEGILQRYGMSTVGKFEEQLQLGIVTRKPWAEMRADLISESAFLQQAPASWAERIVRTETMAAYNRAGWETTRDAQSELGDMVKILSATFDDRTAWDSYLVHGQIRRPDEAFEGPFGMYQHPPNRPNDREVVVPHRISWPLPGSLAPRSVSEAEAAYRSKVKNPGARGGSPPSFARGWPLTTVPREQFGRS